MITETPNKQLLGLAWLALLIGPSTFQFLVLMFVETGVVANAFIGFCVVILYLFIGYAGFVMAIAFFQNAGRGECCKRFFACTPTEPVSASHLLYSACMWFAVNVILCWLWASQLETSVIVLSHLVFIGYAVGFVAGMIRAHLFSGVETRPLV